MLKLLRSPEVSRPVSGILIFLVMLMMDGCYFFKVSRVEPVQVQSLDSFRNNNKFFILHSGESVWHLKNPVFNQDTIKGLLEPLIGHETYKTAKTDGVNRFKSVKKSGGVSVVDEVHIYLDTCCNTVKNLIFFPVNTIKKIEVYDMAKGATIASWTAGMTAATVGAMGVFLLILILTKSSCPFVYVNDGMDYSFAGEIFSGATQPGLERDDYLPLPGITQSEGKYRLMMTNEVKEIQSVNLSKLLLADHPSDVSVLIDKKGKYHTLKNPLQPATAVNGVGRDILDAVCNKDDLNYYSDKESTGRTGIEEVILEFDRPQNATQGKLLVRAKNSFWLDVLFTHFHSHFGDRYDDFTSKQETASGKKLASYMLDQKLPLLLYVENNGKWEYRDYFNIAGPMAFRDDILSIDLKGISSDKIRIKLESGFMFWQIDYTAMDFTEDMTIPITEIDARSAIDGNGVECKSSISKTDEDYLVLSEVGDKIVFEFEAPAMKDSKRSIFLHSGGYYKILRDFTGSADKEFLKGFRKPGRMPEFSKESFYLNLLTSEN